jgi:hypothetical protein
MNWLYHAYIEFLAKNNIPKLFGNITFYIIPFCIIAAALLVVILALVLVERKLLGFFTQRKGPNRVGYWGLLQTLADAFKLLCKENITPQNANRFLYNLAPVLVFVPAMAVLGIIPYSAEFTFVNSATNVVLYIVLAAFPILSIFLAGWASSWGPLVVWKLNPVCKSDVDSQHQVAYWTEQHSWQKSIQPVLHHVFGRHRFGLFRHVRQPCLCRGLSIRFAQGMLR